ncbi:GGDEF domain-containing protein [Gemmatimonas groenlandica]|uniref:diguanylate cyclase n=1 Tax=Gemmatimonas groenlandica TaxID=2732249 RepID=A0A6M4IQW9_9BACT|nr:GGDEF domain-containing protein [Gemmatimonas groenlandica]QJR36169.1 GGDEF domain-containing protein [Gemmatimonas groenlandica]
MASEESSAEAFDIAPLLDAFGQVLSAYAQGSFDLPDVSSSETGEELEKWRRHTVLGIPLTQTGGLPSLSAAQRDYRGAARALTDHRRREKRYVESALSDLRDALWACVERVHTVAQADLQADEATSVQITRVQTAIHGIETRAVKDEVLQAISAITDIARSRRDTQQVAFGMLAERIDQLGSQLEEAKRESETDPLTGLGNRKCFERAAHRAIHLHTLNRAPVSLVLVDLDHLKQINDGFGHSAGDATLQAIAGSLAKVFLRESDVICRIGGDEFVVVLSNTDINVAGRLAERVVGQIAATRAPFATDAPALSASVGYAAYHGSEGAEAWLGRADAALYRAKRDGKGKAVGAE